MNINKYGLSRDISDPIMREVRQRDGFGCVLCGKGIYEYEHVDPPFAEARAHEADKITLLCPGCHHKVTTGMLSKEAVKEGMKNPLAKQQGFSNEWFDYGKTVPDLIIGSNVLKPRDPKSVFFAPVVVYGEPIIMIKRAENTGEPVRITANFTDSNGKRTLIIRDNEWKTSSDVWDVEVTGNSIIVREAARKIHLHLTTEPRKAIKIERLDMILFGAHFKVDASGSWILLPDGSRIEGNEIVSGANAAVVFGNKRV